jgi:hypothetical protein
LLRRKKIIAAIVNEKELADKAMNITKQSGRYNKCNLKRIINR